MERLSHPGHKEIHYTFVMKVQWRIFFTAVLCTGMYFPAPVTLQAHEGDDHVEEAEQQTSGRVLGRISFPTTSKSPEAQQAFIDGMLLLHLFEYPFARDEFLEAQRLDPGFSMAYWGEAMTWNHPIWDEQNLEAGRAALMKLADTPEKRITSTPASREQGFLAAVELLYGSGTKAQRDLAYMRAMEQLAVRYPDDHEVQLFYALSLFGVEAGVRDTSAYMMCTALAQDVFSENPDHPGAAHYLIHGVDDPVHAVLGLRAARALAIMAPDAGHSQHMTSHIFTAVGMWGDVVTANEAAVKVQNAMREERGMSARHWGHYNYWLLYGYLQQGRFDRALELLQAAYAESQADGKAPENPLNLDPDRSLVGSVVQMWARYVIDTRDWGGEVANWSFNSGSAFDPNLTISFIRAMQAAHAGMTSQVSQYLGQFRRLKFELADIISRQEEQAPTDLLYLDRLAVMEQELLAAVEYSKGEFPMAVRFASEASRLEGEMPYSFGPPFVDLPAAEYLGYLLLESRKFQEAADAYEIQLERSRQKTLSLSGLAQALEKLGRETEAEYIRGKLERIRSGAESPLEAGAEAPD
jgi:tetratricopeptide (TPR) repeat protein